jgi:acyl-CoA synthetase (AMP-forming)/AMP-acid ligase II
LSNPLALLPIALAAAGGRVNGTLAASAVAAGFTLLQRSAAVVRALAGRRSAILLPPSSAVLTALAASDGRGAVLLPASADTETLGSMLEAADVGAIFTTASLAAQLPPSERAVALLDDAPRSATVVARGIETVVDLGSHFGLDLEGEEDDGSDEECMISYASTPQRRVYSHRDLFTLARFAVDATSLNNSGHALALMSPDHVEAFALSYAGPLLAGARVSTMEKFDADEAARLIADDGISHVSADAAMYAALADAVERRGGGAPPSALRVCVCLGAAPTSVLHDRWHRLTGIELRAAHGIEDAPHA